MSGRRRVKSIRPASRNEDAGAGCAAWAPRPGAVTDTPMAMVLLGRDNGVAVKEYDFDADALSGTIYEEDMELGRPLRLAVHPDSAGVLCSFANSSKYFDLDFKGASKLKASERDLPLLQGIGIQNSINFSPDGLFVGAGGKDGHLRVFTWPDCELVFEEPQAHRSIQDLDISMDSAYVATTGEDGTCRVWELRKNELVVDLKREKDEKFGCCKFSREGKQAFLYTSITKGKRGYIAVWNMMDWSKIGSKKLANAPISYLATTRNGKSLGLGTTEGDVAVISVMKMDATQLINGAHGKAVTGLEFSKKGRSLLSVGADSTALITRLERTEWKEWQLHVLLIGMIIVSGILFYWFHQSEAADRFFQFPMGRKQSLHPPEAVWSSPSHEEL